MLSVPTEHGLLRLKRWCAGIEQVVLLASLIHLACHKPSPAIWFLRVSLIAVDPPTPDEDEVLVLVHLVLGSQFPNALIEVVELFNNGSANEGFGQHFARVLVQVLAFEVIGAVGNRNLASSTQSGG